MKVIGAVRQFIETPTEEDLAKDAGKLDPATSWGKVVLESEAELFVRKDQASFLEWSRALMRSQERQRSLYFEVDSKTHAVSRLLPTQMDRVIRIKQKNGYDSVVLRKFPGVANVHADSDVANIIANALESEEPLVVAIEPTTKEILTARYPSIDQKKR